MTSAKGLSLHIGLSHLNRACYPDPGDPLPGSVNDAVKWKAFAASQGLQTHVLADQQATREAVYAHLLEAARQLSRGDLFVLTFSGHGSQLPAPNTSFDSWQDRTDQRNETWCLWNGHLLDDELWRLWAHFEEGVRIVAVLDSCHSDDGLRDNWCDDPCLASFTLPKCLPLETWAAGVRAPDYQAIRATLPQAIEVRASICQLAACAEDGTAYGSDDCSLYLACLLHTLEHQRPATYQALHDAVYARIQQKQKPVLRFLDPRDPAFEQQGPFSLR